MSAAIASTSIGALPDCGCVVQAAIKTRTLPKIRRIGVSEPHAPPPAAVGGVASPAHRWRGVVFPKPAIALSNMAGPFREACASAFL